VNNIVHPCSNNIVESLTADEWLIALLTRAPPIEDIHFFVPPSPVEFSLPCGIQPPLWNFRRFLLNFSHAHGISANFV
jgi:hypothetical protein